MLTRSDIALIVSHGQNEIEDKQARDLNIEPHPKRMNESVPGLGEKFKDTEAPFCLVFVCAMWLTGFDAPSCSTLYLGKPCTTTPGMMQTIARA